MTMRQVQLRSGTPEAGHLTPLPFLAPRMAPLPGRMHMSFLASMGRIDLMFKEASAQVMLRNPAGIWHQQCDRQRWSDDNNEART